MLFGQCPNGGGDKLKGASLTSRSLSKLYSQRSKVTQLSFAYFNLGQCIFMTFDIVLSIGIVFDIGHLNSVESGLT